MSIVLCLLAGVFALGYYFVKRNYNFWIDKGFVSPAPNFPFGSLKGVGTKITYTEAMDLFYKKYKGKSPVVGLFFFFQPTVLIVDPELYKNVFVRDFASFHDRWFYYNKEDDPLTANLLSLEGQVWRERRVKMSPIFTSGKMKIMFETVHRLANKLIDVIDKELTSSSDLETSSWLTRFTGDVIGNVAFGLDCNCLEDPDSIFLQHGKKMSTPSAFQFLKFFFSANFPNISRKLRVRMHPKESADFFLSTFIDTMNHREKNKINRGDFVSMLLGLKEFFTPEELAAESFLVYIGGLETSATLITFTIFELALNPEIQDRLREEIQSELEQNDNKLTYEMLFGFMYLDKVVKECLRKYPPIPNTNRKCTKEYAIPGTDLIIPAGASIELNFYSLQRDPEYYAEPEKFDPERFSPENCRERNPFTFLPFGEGPRNCIGMRFGLMQAKLAIVKLVQNYQISLNSKSPIPLRFVPSSPFLVPVGGMWLTLNKI